MQTQILPMTTLTDTVSASQFQILNCESTLVTKYSVILTIYSVKKLNLLYKDRDLED